MARVEGSPVPFVLRRWAQLGHLSRMKMKKVADTLTKAKILLTASGKNATKSDNDQDELPE